MNTKTIKIQLLKNFHWLLATFFAIAWLSGDDWMQMHIFAGYGILIISSIFIIKHFFNGQIFKWSRPSLKFNWLKSNLILLILASLLLASVSGLLADSSGKDFWEDFHELLANFSLIAVTTHIALKALNKLKKQTMANNPLLSRGHHYMNTPILKKSYYWLLTKWQQITIHWQQSSGKNLLLRGALISLSLAYTVLITSIFLTLLPLILVSAVLIALLVKSDITNQSRPITIDVTAQSSHL